MSRDPRIFTSQTAGIPDLNHCSWLEALELAIWINLLSKKGTRWKRQEMSIYCLTTALFF
jgi:hypothetical protein